MDMCMPLAAALTDSSEDSAFKTTQRGLKEALPVHDSLYVLLRP